MSTPEIETFSLEEVGEMHDVTVDWLRRRITSGETPAVLFGKRWRMTPSDIATLVDQMREAGQRKLAELADGTDGRARRRTDTESTAPADAGLSPRAARRMKRRTAADAA